MLSRHAENLFWIGRYVERAEGTARLLDVTYHGVLEAGSERSPEDLWSELLETLFLEDEVPDLESGMGDRVGELLIADRAYPGSIVSNIGRARENARTTREWLSVEVWESLNDLHLQLARTDLVGFAHQQPYEVLRRVRAGCQGVFGAVDSSMPRSDGYRFLVIGQHLERALIAARVLSVWQRRLGGFGAQAAFAEWVKLLKSVSAYEAYLRAFRASMDGRQVLAFLLQANDFPRSVLHCVSLIESLLGTVEAPSQVSALRRTLGRLRNDVEFTEAASLGPGLESFLDDLERALRDLSTEIDDVFFRPAKALYMHSYETF